MFPDQQNQNGGQPQYGAAPAPQQPLQAPNGQYDVVPPLPVGQNNGHSGHNPYEFIVNPAKPKRGPRFSMGSGSGFLMKIGLLVGGVAVLMIIAAVIISALGPKSVTPQLTAIVQRQQEIIRVATAASKQATGQDTQNFVTNVGLSVTSDQQQVEGYLTSHGTKLNAKLLVVDHSTQTDTLLANAANAGTYDTTVTGTLSDQLQTYQNLLQKAYGQTSSKTTKQMLQSCYNTASGLIRQAKAISSGNPS